MSATLAEQPRLIHATTGRMRVHLPGWSGGGPRKLETELRQVKGVRSVQANPLTGNVLIRFDPAETDATAVLARVLAVEAEADSTGAAAEPAEPPVLQEGRGPIRRARIAVRGIDRDPRVARHVVEHLQRHPGVKARANPLTGRVLVEFDKHQVDLEDLLSEVADLELPDLPGEDRPSHPLDSAPLMQSATRTVGAALGLGLLVVRRLRGIEGTPASAATAATAAGVIGLLQGFPFVRNGLRTLLGRDTADLIFQGAAIVTLTFAGSPLGLAVTGTEAVRLLTEVLARRAAWRHYEERLAGAASALPGEVIRLESGERTPRAAQVIEGTGTAIGRDGLPVPLQPGSTVRAGARLSGGPFVLQLRSHDPFVPQPRPAPVAPSLYDRYTRVVGLASLAYAAATAVLTGSFARTFEALLLVNPRTAIIGMEAANLDAAARVLRAGVTIVDTRPGRIVRRPDLLLLDGPRVLTDGVELTSVLPLTETTDASEILSLAGGVAAAAGSPWGRAFPRAGHAAVTDGDFDGRAATAAVGSVRYTLEPVEDPDRVPAASRIQHRGDYLLLLRSDRDEQPLGLFALRPRLAPGAAELIHACGRRGVEVALLGGGDPLAAQAVARRTAVPLLDGEKTLDVIRARQRTGAIVAFASDSAEAAEAFSACDLAIGLSSGRSGRFPARADLLAPDLNALAAIIDAGAQREAGVRDGVGFSVIANLTGAVWGFRGRPGVERASRVVYITALAALADGWLRLRGGDRPRSALTYLVDPRPERWGRRPVASVLKTLETTEAGLTAAEAARRRRQEPKLARRSELLTAILDQLRAPVTGVLAVGAGLSFILGEPADAAIIGATIAVNVAVGVWQERQAGQAAEALQRMGTATARVLRAGMPILVPAPDVVAGDVLLLAPGDRVAADARLISVHGLEVDEAALTGESLPVPKTASGGTAESHVILEGSDITVGTGRAVVVAVGRHTRMGATAAALALDQTQASPLGARLGRMLRLALPLSIAGGGIVLASGLLRGGQLLPLLAIGTSVAVAVIPEGLPLLAGTGEAMVARRLAGHHAVVRRLAAVEALGRVDVACTDKTGTLTRGRLALSLVADPGRETTLPGVLSADLRRVLLTAALASPHPDAADAAAHPTDVAVIRGAEQAGLGGELRVRREAEVAFDPVRSFHATLAQGRLCVKGSPEALTPRCDRVRRDGGDQPLDEAGRHDLLGRAQRFAEWGLRVLMVAEGPPGAHPEDPHGLVALGYLGISDPLRPGVADAVRRCHEAGVRVMMLTGDHPATARAIARDAGLWDGGDGVLTGSEIAELHNGDLDRRLERAAVIARVTPLDKLRIVESLQRHGHTVAMTGDGVNDAPALRLADVGVAMGRGGTEVARQAADVVLTDDDFATLVEALVEGRGFWRNMRRALGLLLGGNVGELGLLVGASIMGFTAPLNTPQILAVNLITDALPALSVVLQRPEHRNLAALAREGTTALDVSLRTDVLQRGTSTAVPALAAYLVAYGSSGGAQASAVAFASIVANQLAQTLDAGWTEGSLSRPVVSAVAGSAGLLIAALTVPPVRDVFSLVTPAPLGWALIGTGALAAVLMSRALSSSAGPVSAPLAETTGRLVPPTPRPTVPLLLSGP